MIKFFRTIRHKLLTENKVSKYVLYAIGEIVLVVIGILIALQINAWNQFKKDRLEEQNILERIEKDLKADIADLTIQTNRNNRWQENLQLLIEGILDRNISLEDFVNRNRTYGVNTYFMQTAGTYKESVASGKLSLIVNDSLRNQIIKHYEIMEIGTDDVLKNQMNQYIRPTFYKSFGSSKEFVENVTGKTTNLSPIDMNTVYNNKDYLASITVKLQLMQVQNLQFSGQIRRTEKVLNAIRNELNQRWP